jgi:multidrug efflux pump subunit AcrA (membrane-fusion protein)
MSSISTLIGLATLIVAVLSLVAFRHSAKNQQDSEALAAKQRAELQRLELERHRLEIRRDLYGDIANLPAAVQLTITPKHAFESSDREKLLTLTNSGAGVAVDIALKQVEAVRNAMIDKPGVLKAAPQVLMPGETYTAILRLAVPPGTTDSFALVLTATWTDRLGVHEVTESATVF